MDNKTFSQRLEIIASAYRELLCEWARDAADEEKPEVPQELFLALRPMLGMALGGGGFLEMLVGPQGRTEGLKELRDFSRGKEKLIICDPYIFSGRTRDAAAIATDF